jgi:hypothetical protein
MRNENRNPWKRLFPLATAAVLALVPLTGCGNEDPAETLAEAAEESTFTPPADGRLSPDQVEMYLKVRDRELEILAETTEDVEAKSTGETISEVGGKATERAPAGKVTVSEVPAEGREELAELVTADVTAAQELGADPIEYRWVKGQVLQAQVARYHQGWEKLSVSGRQQAIQALREMRGAVQNPSLGEEIEQRITELEQVGALEPEESLQHNMDLVTRYEPQILALEEWPKTDART